MANYIWYSGATDVTGRALAEALGITGTRNRPRLRAGDIVIGWGTKTNENVNMAQATVLNHPNKIRSNRNKLSALEKMAANRDLSSNVAKFVVAGEVMRTLGRRRSPISLPLIGRTRYHQGGKGLWLCLTNQHVEKAVQDGAQYFQNYVPIANEYRLHVAFGSVIKAVKKVENPTNAGWIAQRKEKVMDYANKNNRNMDETTLDYALSILVKEVVLPDRIVRSNRRGWKFSNVRLNNVSTPLKNAAIKAVEVLGLDFGAVDCAMGLDNTPYIIEVNSGPGLQGSAFDKYVEAFRDKIAELQRPARPAQRRQARRPTRRNERAQAAGVGAENAANNGVALTDEALILMMNEVQTPEEARRILRLAGRNS